MPLELRLYQLFKENSRIIYSKVNLLTEKTFSDVLVFYTGLSYLSGFRCTKQKTQHQGTSEGQKTERPGCSVSLKSKAHSFNQLCHVLLLSKTEFHLSPLRCSGWDGIKPSGVCVKFYLNYCLKKLSFYTHLKMLTSSYTSDSTKWW